MLLSGALAAAETAPEVKSIEAPGASVYDAAQLQRILRLKPGDHLWRGAAAAAHSLQTRYRLDGYFAAKVIGRFEEADGRLVLEVDEGRLVELVLPGLSEAARRSARRALALEPGVLLQERPIARGLAALASASEDAFGEIEPPYDVTPVAGGVRLTLPLATRPPRLGYRVRGPATASLYNRVEGLAPGAGAELWIHDPVSFNHLYLYGRASYGLDSEAVRYATGVRKPFGAAHRLLLGFERHDLTDTDDSFRSQGVEEPAGKGIYFEISEDYYRRRGQEAYALLRLSPRAHLGVTWRDDLFSSLPVVADGSFVFSRTPRPNPEIDAGRLHALLLTARFATRDALYPSWRSERESFPDRRPYGPGFDRRQGLRADLSVEIADAGGLGGDFSFTRSIAHLHGARAVGAQTTLLGRALVGFTTGAPPLQRRFALGGIGTLRGRELKTMTGDRMALVSFECERQIRPSLPALALFYDGGTTFGGARFAHDAGLGARWPGIARALVRLDLGVPLNREPGESRARLTGRLVLPF